MNNTLLERAKIALRFISDRNYFLTDDELMEMAKMITGEITSPVITPYQFYNLCHYIRASSKKTLPVYSVGPFEIRMFDHKDQPVTRKKQNIYRIEIPSHDFEVTYTKLRYGRNSWTWRWHYTKQPTNEDLILLKLCLKPNLLRLVSS